jgi:UDP-glucose 6-dehydrogenase
MTEKKMGRISIIGSGWVGTNIGKGFSDLGYEVIFYDVVDKNSPNFTKDLNYAIEASNVSFICVPTPTGRE